MKAYFSSIPPLPHYPTWAIRFAIKCLKNTEIIPKIKKVLLNFIRSKPVVEYLAWTLILSYFVFSFPFS